MYGLAELSYQTRLSVDQPYKSDVEVKMPGQGFQVLGIQLALTQALIRGIIAPKK